MKGMWVRAITAGAILSSSVVACFDLGIGPALSVTTTSLPDGVENVAYGTETLTATGGDGPYTWSVAAGSLPTGLSLNATTGDITGTPTVVGTSDFTIEVTSGTQTDPQTLSITVNATLVVTTTSLPDGDANVDYGTETLTAAGGDGSYTWALASGSGLLPTGLSLATTGDITGTPTVVAVGTSDFTIEVTSGTQTDTRTLTLTVNPVDATPSGVIDSNTTWTAADGPYLVTGNVLVSQAVTLTIEPGTRVVFDGLYYIKVEGELVAIGTPTDSVVFTSGDSQPAAGDWSKIWFASESVDATVDADGDYVSGSAISHAVISYGGAIHFDASSPYFSNNHVHHVTGSPPRDWPNGAIWTCNSASLIRDNVIEDNPLSGIVVLGGAVQIQRNVIRRNTGHWGGGIFFANANCAAGASGTSVVEDNEITGNTATFGGGIALYSGSPKITHNDIKDNVATGTLMSGTNAQGNGTAITLFSGGGPEITYNNIEDNSSTSSGESTAFFFSRSFSGIIEYNTLSNPTTYEIYLNSDLTTDVDATSNYWNTTATTEIDARIWDDNDDFELGLVGYTPILMSRETTSGPRP